MGKISGGISVSFWFVTVIALLAYWGNGAIIPFLAAIIIHELSHIVAIFICGYEIQKINF